MTPQINPCNESRPGVRKEMTPRHVTDRGLGNAEFFDGDLWRFDRMFTEYLDSIQVKSPQATAVFRNWDFR